MKMMIDDKKHPRKGEIWLIDYTYNYKSDNSLEVESMLKKLCPSLIISNDEQNKNTSDIIICPISSKDNKEIKSFEMSLKSNSLNNLTKDSKIILNLIFTMNKEFQLKKFIGKLNDQEMKTVEDKLKIALDFNY